MTIRIWQAAVAALAFAGFMGASPAKAVIYGSDDRKDVDAPVLVNSPIPQLARGTAILISRQQVRQSLDFNNTFDYIIDGGRLRDRFALCEADPFQDQFAPGFCSSFLVTPNTLVTAGHCIATASACQNTAVVFGFSSHGTLNGNRHASSDDVYFCKEVVSQRIDPTSGVDYAVIHLDRPAFGRTPLSLRQESDLRVGTTVGAIAYPHGAPAKYIGGANVRDPGVGKAFFVANIDGFTGNSGAPVLGPGNQVEGIIVRGDNSYLQTESCLKPIHCDNDACRGEDVVKSDQFRDKVPFETPSTPIIHVDTDDGDGNGNGYPEPGEKVKLAITIMNAGKTTATGLRMALRTHGYGELSHFPATLPNLAPGEPLVIRDVWLNIPAKTSCNQAIVIDLATTYDNGHWNSSYTLPLGREAFQTYRKDFEADLADYLPNGQAFAIDVPEAPRGRRVFFGIDITHAQPTQLIIAAKAPDGTASVLYKNGLPRTQYPTPASPETVSGLYGIDVDPFNDIAPFRHVAAAGTWQIVITDIGRGAAARLHGASILIADRQCEAP